MSYTRTTWEDFPSTATAITAALLNNMESGIFANDSAVTDISSELPTLYRAISWAFDSVFPDYLIYRLHLFPTTTPTLFGTNGYFDLDTTQNNYNYTKDGMILYRNDKMINPDLYHFHEIVNGTVTIDDVTYTSDVTTGVRVQFLNVRFDNTDALDCLLYVKPAGAGGASTVGQTRQILTGTTNGSVAGVSSPAESED